MHIDSAPTSLVLNIFPYMHYSLSEPTSCDVCVPLSNSFDL